MGDTVAAPEPVVHRALASPSRRRLLEFLRQASEPVDAATLAGALDLHVTTVRGHLALLEQAGLVGSTHVRSGRPGRPATVYVATGRPPTPERTAGYQLLAEVLVDGLQASPEAESPAQWARATGDRWGPRLIDRMELRGTGTPTEILHASFDAMGFEPETTDEDIRLHACPFVDLAIDHEEVICGLHLGMAEGMLRTLDADVGVDDLVPFARPSVCVLALTR